MGLRWGHFHILDGQRLPRLPRNSGLAIDHLREKNECDKCVEDTGRGHAVAGRGSCLCNDSRAKKWGWTWRLTLYSTICLNRRTQKQKWPQFTLLIKQTENLSEVRWCFFFSYLICCRHCCLMFANYLLIICIWKKDYYIIGIFTQKVKQVKERQLCDTSHKHRSL